MTLVGRAQLDHPALGAAGGSALHASIESIYTNIGNDLAARYDTAASIANSAVTTFTHNFGVQFADLKLLLYTGTHPNLVRVADPTASGWVIAANGGNLKTQIDVTAPSSGGPHTFAVITMQSRGAEKLADLDDINTTAPIDGQFLIYDTATSKWIPAYLKYKSETATIASNTLTPTTGANVQRITSGAADLQMVASPVAGKLYVLVNETGTDFLLKNDTGGTAANRIYTGTGVDLTLKNQAAITLIYNSGLSRWIVAGGSGGGGLATELKSTTFIATAGKHYLVDNSASAFTGTLPAGSAGSVIRFSDNSRVWASRNFTIAPASGETIDGLAANETLVCDVSGAFVQVMWNGTKWIVDTNGFAASISSGSLSGGQGLGKKNYIGNPNNATNWVTGGSSLTVTTETTAGNLPNQITQSTALAFTRVSGTTGYGGFRFEMDRSDYSKPFEVNIDQKSAFTTEGYQIQVFAGSVFGTYGTQLTVANASLTGLTGSHIARCDMPGSATPFIEFRIVATGASGTAPFYANNIYFGPGLTPQSYAGGEYVSYNSTLFTPADGFLSAGTGGSASTASKYRRVGSAIEVIFQWAWGSSGATFGTAGTYQLGLPSGMTVDATQLPTPSASGDVIIGTGLFWDNSLADSYGLAVTWSGSAIRLGVEESTSGAGIGPTTPVTPAVSDGIWAKFTVPIASMAGNGILNVGAGAQIEYAYNTDVSSTATVTGSGFASGPAGIQYSASWTTNTAWTRTVQWQYPIQDDDMLELQVYSAATSTWVRHSDLYGDYTRQNTRDYGPRLIYRSTTQTDVLFCEGGFRSSGVAFGDVGAVWSGLTNTKWRVRKAKASSPVGFGLAGTDGSSGLYMAGRAPGLVTGAAISSGYIGEFNQGTLRSGTNGFTYSTRSTTPVSNSTYGSAISITLNKGVYLISGKCSCFSSSGVGAIYAVIHVGGTAVTDATHGYISTANTGAAVISAPIVVTADSTVVAIYSKTDAAPTPIGPTHEMFAVRIA